MVTAIISCKFTSISFSIQNNRTNSKEKSFVFLSYYSTRFAWVSSSV